MSLLPVVLLVINSVIWSEGTSTEKAQGFTTEHPLVSRNFRSGRMRCVSGLCQISLPNANLWRPPPLPNGLRLPLADPGSWLSNLRPPPLPNGLRLPLPDEGSWLPLPGTGSWPPLPNPGPWRPIPQPNPGPWQPSTNPDSLPGPPPSGVGVGCGVQAPAFQPSLYRPSARIINGVEARPHSWPWVMALAGGNGQKYFKCGLSLLRVRADVEASDIALTASHCVVRAETMNTSPQPHPPSYFVVIAGKHHREVAETYQQSRQVVGVRMHPNFYAPPVKNVGPRNDLALIKLASPIQFNDAIRPVCLPQEGAPIPVGQTCVAAGWGQSGATPGNAEALQQLVLPVHPASTCAQSWGVGYDEQKMLCAGSLEAQSGVCHGDSGGMLACRQSDGRWAQYGIVSWGVADSCLERNKAAVFTRVSSYVGWINQAIQQMSSLRQGGK